MFDNIAPRYDLVNRIMTFGADVRWRRRAVEMLGLEPGALVADVACGTGDFCRELERAEMRAVGFDFSYGMLAAAATDAPLVQADGLRLPVRDHAFDGATCGFALRNVVDIPAILRELARIVSPGGRVAVLEVGEPDSRLVRSGHHVYFHKVVPLIGGALSDRDAYKYLPESTAYLPPPDELRKLFVDSGFATTARVTFMFGAAQLIVGRTAE